MRLFPRRDEAQRQRSNHPDRSLVDYGAVPTSPPARFHQPPFKPYVRFSRIRLNDDLLGVACAA